MITFENQAYPHVDKGPFRSLQRKTGSTYPQLFALRRKTREGLGSPSLGMAKPTFFREFLGYLLPFIGAISEKQRFTILLFTFL